MKKPSIKLQAAISPAQNVAVQIRQIVFNLKAENLKAITMVEKALAEGVNDGVNPEVKPAEIIRALGEVDYATVQQTVAEFKEFLS